MNESQRGDSSGSAGDAPMEMLASKPSYRSTKTATSPLQRRQRLRCTCNFEAALFRDPEDELRFPYPADHPLASEFEGEMIELEREYLK